ncbi:helix-hairpin-helix domain-containing protein [Schinkia azotoformans]|uniref:helix-hairpin-helix domain-containing protein n=1 Tax=Schinkia azotoformans TaxID=1454 RepID=UPI002DB59DF9|nr:helix-hairpin-helix domain-containing protein [Schinkia azotoformans]MEC1720195.1 helix-hairpin-helix domain-containing protein [Schinkia azotoformans]MED4353538.1 helix-hairpin-helix domain-containing protein [Schinkia azotoformans]MED4413198.1 helix-hairpin-helix domain-containing protein [Schinkia azotoformans]
MAQIIIDKKRITIIAVIIFVFILFLFIKLYDRNDKTEEITTMAELEKEEVAPIPEKLKPSIVYIDIKGAVVKPGVYKLEDGKRVLDAIQMAGGFQTDADQIKINLAARVTDEMVLYIPVIGEVIDNNIGLPANEVDDGKININTATPSELESLPGIGAAKAASIITFREQNGPFKEIEDIVNVSGIGAKSFEKLKDQIKVR